MSEAVTFQTGFKVVAPDGTTIYNGMGKVMNATEFVSAEASASFAAGEAVRFSTTSVVGRLDSTASTLSEDLYGLRVSAAANTGFMGVAMNQVPFGKTGWYAGSGSIVGVKSLASASLTSNTAAAAVIGSSTAGAVNTTAANAAGSATNLPAGGTMLGRVLKIAGTTGGSTDMGSDTQLGIIVAPW